MAEDKNSEVHQPGAVITPADQSPQAPVATPDPVQVEEEEGPVRAAQAISEASQADEVPEAEEVAEPEEQLSPEEQPQAIEADDSAVVWTASEFVQHHKSIGWYLILMLVALVLAVAFYFFTKEIITPVVVIVAALFFGVYGSHKPRELEYSVSNQGIQIGKRFFPYSNFRSFSVAPEGVFGSVIFMPLKRFALTTTIYYPPDEEEKIMAVLAAQLPFEEHKPDAIDSLMRQIRF